MLLRTLADGSYADIGADTGLTWWWRRGDGSGGSTESVDVGGAGYRATPNEGGRERRCPGTRERSRRRVNRRRAGCRDRRAPTYTRGVATSVHRWVDSPARVSALS